MHIFYTPDINGTVYTLNENESKHCVRVLRLSVNDEIVLVDGIGGWYDAKIIDAHPKRCVVEVFNTVQQYGKSDFYLHVAIAPTKNIDRFEWFLEKAVEIGIDEVTPLLCSNSERKVVKEERLQKIMVAAMKQSLKAYLPKLNPLTRFDDLIPNKADATCYIAHCENDDKIHLKDIVSRGGSQLVLIGPEGDFSNTEISIALQNEFQPISLGESRLRTETAGVVATHIINLANE